MSYEQEPARELTDIPAKELTDIPRLFALDVDVYEGWREYGNVIYDVENTETLTENDGEAQIRVLKKHSTATKGITPLPYGSIVRLMLYGSLDAKGNPILESENGVPKNYRNYFVTAANSRWFENLEFGAFYLHEYSLEELIGILRDFPIRSTKTFAEGAYTYKKCLEIAFTLAFKPQRIEKFAFSIKNIAGLNSLNTRLDYTNATLYDVVTDIGRIIDAVPTLEIEYELASGIYTFVLSFVDRYGLEGKTHDIYVFNQMQNDSVSFERATSAGGSITNAQNISGQSAIYPMGEGMIPSDTNLEKSMDYFQLPYNIEEVEEIHIQWRYEIPHGDNPQDENKRITIVDTGEIYQPETEDETITLLGGEKIRILHVDNTLTNTFAIISKDSSKTTQFYEPTNSNIFNIDKKSPKSVFLKAMDEYKYLPQAGSDTQPTQENTIYYTRGDNKIYIGAIYGKSVPWYEYNASSPDRTLMRNGNEFVRSPNTTPSYKGGNVFKISVRYKPMTDIVVKMQNDKPSDYTTYYNQQSQTVDVQSFGAAVQNYMRSMNGESRICAKFYDTQDIRSMYENMPAVGESVEDELQGKRYVITDTSFTRKPRGGQLLAYLTETRSGKSRIIMASNSQRIFAIPNENIVDSKTHAHIVCRMSVKPLAAKPTVDINKVYLFNALLNTASPLEKILTTEITPKDMSPIVLPSTMIRSPLNVFLINRMMSNSVAKIENGELQLYTDNAGKMASMKFSYRNIDNQVVLSFTQTIEKDAYEIINHTTQVSWVEMGELRIGESMVLGSSFVGGYSSEKLYIGLLKHPVSYNDPSIADATFFEATASDMGDHILITAPSMTDIPQHTGWIVMREGNMILLDNFGKMSNNTIKVYYNIEVMT